MPQWRQINVFVSLLSLCLCRDIPLPSDYKKSNACGMGCPVQFEIIKRFFRWEGTDSTEFRKSAAVSPLNRNIFNSKS